jgi:hypothetical protein
MMRTGLTFLILLGLLLLPGAAIADDEEAAPADGAVRVGTFDSRLVAIAYARSAFFQKKILEDMAKKDPLPLDQLKEYGQ